MWSTPSSTARRRTARGASGSRGGPKTPGPASCIAPKPMRFTVKEPRLVMAPGSATVKDGTRRASIMGPGPPPTLARRDELTDFLRDRRARVTPESAGLDANGRRRTPGLRREEVAQLAGVGLSWYTWLEQGRDIKPSAQVLDALARVLRLDGAERAHLFHLARVELPLPGEDYAREAPAELRAIVDELVPNPAYLIGPRTDVLAWNRAAEAVLGRPTEAPDGRPNLLWWLFTSKEPRGEQWRATPPSPPPPLPPQHASRPARISGRGGLATRCSPSSSARRRSSTPASARFGCTTCSRSPQATPTCVSPSSRRPTRPPAPPSPRSRPSTVRQATKCAQPHGALV